MSRQFPKLREIAPPHLMNAAVRGVIVRNLQALVDRYPEDEGLSDVRGALDAALVLFAHVSALEALPSNPDDVKGTT